ncbi:hypothetical protein ABPG72_012356 [Tetrahymena utriculariae]
MKSENQTEICKIRQLLLEKKNLVMTNRNLQGPLTQSYIFVEEENNTFVKYALKVKKIANEESGEIDQLKLLKCNHEVQLIKDCCHQNIGEVVDEFVIDQYHFIQFQDVFCTLTDWMRQNQGRKISDYQFVSFAGKLLDGLEFIHEKQCFLNDISLNTLLINKDDEIKICSFCQDSPELITFQNQGQNFIQSLPYKPPEFIEKFYNKEIYQSTKQGDIWSYGACLSFLGGGQIKQVQKNKNESQFMITYCHNISKKSNEFVKFILNIDPLKRPNLSEIRDKLNTFFQNSIQKTISKTASQLTNIEEEEEEEQVIIQMEENSSHSVQVLSLMICIQEILTQKEIKSPYEKLQSYLYYFKIICIISMALAIAFTSSKNAEVLLISLAIQFILTIIQFIQDKKNSIGQFSIISFFQSIFELSTLIFTTSDYQQINIIYSLFALLQQIQNILPYLQSLQDPKQSQDNYKSQNQQEAQNKNNGEFSNAYFIIFNCIPIFICISLASDLNLKIISTIRLIVFYLAYISIQVQIKYKTQFIKSTTQFDCMIRICYISLNILDFFIFYQDLTQISNFILAFFCLANTIFIGFIASKIFSNIYLAGQLLYTFASVSSFIAQQATQQIQIECYLIFGLSSLVQFISLAISTKQYQFKTIEKWIQILLFLIHITLFSILLNQSLQVQFIKGRNYGIAFFCCLIFLAKFALKNLETGKQKYKNNHPIQSN